MSDDITKVPEGVCVRTSRFCLSNEIYFFANREPYRFLYIFRLESWRLRLG